MRVVMLVLAVLLALTQLTANASARPFARLWVFGDSTVDTGWYNTTPSGERQFDAYLSTYNLAIPRHDPPTYDMGKPTSNPGPMSVQTLAEILGLEARPANVGGTNYATSGARNDQSNAGVPGLFPNAIPTDQQIARFLDHLRRDPFLPPFDDDDLFVISSGGNDVSYAISNPFGTVSDPASYIQGAASALADTIATLQSRGGRHIIVVNLPESFGTSQEMTYRHIYNTALMNALNSLKVDFAWGDLNSLRLKIVANPASFNISYTEAVAGQWACPEPAAGFNITSAWALVCSPSSPVTQPVSASFAAAALFADNEHWATGGQRILGSYYYCLARESWPRLFRSTTFPFGRAPQPPTPCNNFLPILVTSQSDQVDR